MEETIFGIIVAAIVCLLWLVMNALDLEDYLKPMYTFILLKKALKKFNKYLNKNNLKQMNLKILGKAMGFMFLPTLGVLLLLIVGFFDPIAMWVWIKSNSGWAVFTRIVIFLLEVGLVTGLYFYYMEKLIIDKVSKGEEVKKYVRGNYNGYTEFRKIFANGTSENTYTVYNTESPHIKVIQIKEKE